MAEAGLDAVLAGTLLLSEARVSQHELAFVVARADGEAHPAHVDRSHLTQGSVARVGIAATLGRPDHFREESVDRRVSHRPRRLSLAVCVVAQWAAGHLHC